MKRAVGLGIQSEPPPIPGGLSSDSHRRDLFLLVGDAQAASGCLRLPAGPTLLTGLQLQEPLNVGLIVADAAGRVVAVHGLALFIYQKLLVVPTDVAVADGRVVKPGTIEERVARLRAASLEESVERVLGGAIDFDLAEEGDGIRNEIVSGTNVTNAVVNLLSRRPRLLQMELVAREGQKLEIGTVDRFQCIHFRVLDGTASVTRNIHDENHLEFIVSKKKIEFIGLVPALAHRWPRACRKRSMLTDIRHPCNLI